MLDLQIIQSEINKRSIPLTLGSGDLHDGFHHFPDGYYIRVFDRVENSKTTKTFAFFNFKRMGWKEVFTASENDAGDTVIGTPSKQFTALTKAALKEAKELRNEKFRKAKSVCETIFEMQTAQSSRIQPDYLIRKGFATQLPAPAYAVDNSGDNQTLLVVPGFDEKGELWTLQTIFANGSKQFQNSSRVKEVFHILGCEQKDYQTVEAKVPRILIAEGFATSLACYLSAEVPTLCCFSAANLKAGAAFAHRKYPNAEIIICADNDAGTFLKIAENPGIKAAIEAAMVTPSHIAYPFSDTANKDFCDLWPDFSAIKNVIANFEPVSMTKHLFSCLFEPRAKVKREKKATEVRKLKAAVDPRTLSPETAQLISEVFPVTILEGPEIMKTETPPETPLTAIDDTPLEITYFDDPWVPETFAINTRETGFHDEIRTERGVRRKPNPQDLRLALYEETPYVTHEVAGILYKFNGKFWQLLQKFYIANFCDRNYFPKPDNKTVSEFFGACQRYKLVPAEFFQTEKLINFDNGYLNTDKLEFHSHTPEIGFKNALNYSFDPDAKCPNWDKFILAVSGGAQDSVNMIEEYLGYILSGSKCWAQVALVLTGNGSNGKSTFIQLIRELIGYPNISSAKMDELNQSVYSRQRLDGKLANIAEETPKESLLESSFFKDMVSGGRIEVREIYGSPYDLEVRAKLIFSCNALPTSTDSSHAFYRRFLIMPFDKKFEAHEADRKMGEKLSAEIPGIFNRCLKAYARLKKRGHFKIAEKSSKALDRYREENDHVLRFMREQLTIIPLAPDVFETETFTASNDLYDSFKRWSMDEGIKCLAKVNFLHKLRQELPEGERRAEKQRGTDKRARGLYGVSLDPGTSGNSGQNLRPEQSAARAKNGNGLEF